MPISKEQGSIGQVLSKNLPLINPHAGATTFLLLSEKLVHLYGEIPKEELTKVFDLFFTGELPIGFNFGIVDICKGLKSIGVLTLKQKEDKQFTEKLYKDFYG